MKIYRLEFFTPLHISNVRADYGRSERCIHSDTMYAAIMQAWAILGKNEWITKEPPFAITSLFPFTMSNNEYVSFFPKPYSLPSSNNKNVNEPGTAKKFKKIQFFDKEYFEAFLMGNYNPIKEHMQGQYLAKKTIDKNFIVSQVVPRIRWNRNEKEDSEPFYMEKLYFKEGSGLWFAFYGEKDVQQKFEIALNYLSDAGIGTDRNVGNGRFKFTKEEITLNIPSEANYCINLSLYCPESFEKLIKILKTNEKTNAELDKNIGYDFICRGGWISEPYNTLRKRYVYMFTEGSVFKQKTSGIIYDGTTHDLTPEILNNLNPEHKVFRSGKAIFLPVKFI